MKKKRLFSIILLIITVLIVGVVYPYNQLNNHEDLDAVRSKVEEHLTNKKMKATDYQINVEYHWKSKLFGYDPYVISVQFHDEPDVKYYYKYDYKSETMGVYQNGVAPGGKEDKNFKHAE
ncbi:DUF3139 domain-containing protein [Paenibacillus sp. MMS18-CY102]|uniref:DUF3139 domain-containing protein n=1 Tax=Paenibacillus sp. MMS18-CY102 TaxID=2682849 RepID=UPI001365FD33|nr:DUF3139 domain-containing protein [Paenibacillus sp. MMS18-CY102]MWC30945.1 DUF3139 domain-containing protein [Paenibacillus sp. MMS18-CY102]